MDAGRRWSGPQLTGRNSWRTLRDRLDRLFGAPRAGAVRALEVGCGDGQISELIHQRLMRRHGSAGARLWTLDLDMAQIVAASCRWRRIGGGRVHAVRGDLYLLPVASGSLDYLVAVNVFFWADKRIFLREAQRALGPDGKLFLYDVIPVPDGGPRPLSLFIFERNQIPSTVQ